MTTLNPNHLFEQAARLIAPPPAGPPRQVDIRRAISAAYYGLFHFTLTALADEFVGASHQANARYALIYRSVDHRTLRKTCEESQRQTPTDRFRPYMPSGGFEPGIRNFATTTIDLQARRHSADYNPQPRFKTLDAKVAIAAARSALQQFSQVGLVQRKMFLTLLLCPPRVT